MSLAQALEPVSTSPSNGHILLFMLLTFAGLLCAGWWLFGRK